MASFDETNPDTGKPWTRAELYFTLTAERSKLLIMEEKLLKRQAENEIITWPEQAANIRARWAIHQNELPILVQQVRNLGKTMRRLYQEEIVGFTVFKKS